MNYDVLFQQVKKEFSEEIALKVSIAVALHLSTRVKNKDFEEKGRYDKRVKKKIWDVLWESSSDELDLVIKLWKCVYYWDIDNVLAPEPRTFKQLLEELNMEEKQ